MKKFMCAALSTAMVVSSILPVSAAEIIKEEAELRPDITIIVDEEESYFKSASGDYVFPILFDDSTYLPLRAIGEIMGKNVNWDEKNKTITLSGERDVYKNTTKEPYAKRDDIKVEVRKDFKIVIDGKEKTFKDAKGNRVYPILFDGSTYLPLRAIGEIMDCDVTWDGDDKSVSISKEKLTVTDADSFITDKNIEDLKDRIETKKEELLDNIKDIKEKIIEDAGIKKGVVKFVSIEKHLEHGIWQYEIEFIHEGIEYEYEVEISTGKIISKKTKGSVDDKKDESEYISPEKARKIALKDADLVEEDIRFIETELDKDDDEVKYEIKFKYDGYEYEYEIDAFTGKILDKDVDKD